MKHAEAEVATVNDSMTTNDSSDKVGKSDRSVPSAEPPVQNGPHAVSTAITDTVTPEDSTSAANISHDTITTAPAGTSSVANTEQRMNAGNPGAENLSGKLYRAFQALATLGQLPVKSKLATAFQVPTTQLSDVRKL